MVRLLLVTVGLGVIGTAPALASPTFVFREAYSQPGVFHARFASCIHQFQRAGGLAAQILGQLNRAEIIITYQRGGGNAANPAPNGDSRGHPVEVPWDPAIHGRYAADETLKTPCGVLLHELEHAARFFRGTECTGNFNDNQEAYTYDEALGVRAENWWLRHLGKRQRSMYGTGQSVPIWADWPRRGSYRVPAAPPCVKTPLCPTAKEAWTEQPGLPGSCEVPRGKIAVDVSLGFVVDPKASGTVQVSPAGVTVDARRPPPSYGNPAYGDVFFFATRGTTVTLTANHGPNSYFAGWQAHNGGSCDRYVGQANGSPSGCAFTVDDPYNVQRWQVDATAFFLECPSPGGAGTPPEGAAKDCPGLGTSGR
jgi:hypothetical protein